jgi:hypothetical protein
MPEGGNVTKTTQVNKPYLDVDNMKTTSVHKTMPPVHG